MGREKGFFKNCHSHHSEVRGTPKTVWKKDDVHKTAAAVRQYKERLGYSEQWMTEYVYNVVMLAKKEPKQKDNEEK